MKDEKMANEEWLAQAQENFQEALDDGDDTTAKAVIADMRDKGFTAEARYLEKQLPKELPDNG